MAAELLTNITAALPQLFAAELSRQFNRSVHVLKALTMKDGFGKNLAWDVEFDGATAASYAEGADVATGEFAYDPIVPATLNWGRYRSAFSVSGDAVDAALTSPNAPAALLDLIGERMLGSATKILATIEDDLLTGDGADASSNPTIVGFLGGALAATGVYANIDQGTYAGWAANVLANGSVARALTVDLMNLAEQNIFTASGLNANLIVCSPGVYRKYSGMFEPIRRVTTDGRGPLQYDTVAAELFYKGIPVIRSRAMGSVATGKMIFMNTEECEFVNLPRQRTPDVQQTDGQLADTNGKTGTVTGVRFRLYPLAKTGDASKFALEAKCQLKVKRRNAFAVIEDISET